MITRPILYRLSFRKRSSLRLAAGHPSGLDHPGPLFTLVRWNLLGPFLMPLYPPSRAADDESSARTGQQDSINGSCQLIHSVRWLLSIIHNSSYIPHHRARNRTRKATTNGRKTTIRVRRDTCITLSFDMRSFSTRPDAFDEWKIPSTPSLRNNESETGKRLLHLRIRVLGATTKVPHETLYYECKDKQGNKDAFHDLHAKSNILVPQKNRKSSRISVTFTLACCSRHRKPNDLE